jgi:hypothetical protein
MRENRNEPGILVGKSEGKGTLGRPRRTWEGNIEMDLKDWVVWPGFIWLKRGQWRSVVNTL